MYTPRSFNDILNDYVLTVEEQSGGLVEVNPSSPFYVLARSNAAVIADLESRMVEVYESSSPLTAKGSDLDSLMFIPLISRTSASRSQGSVIIKPTISAIPIPNQTTLTDLDSGLQFYTTQQATTSTALNTIISIESYTEGFSNNLPAGTALFSPLFPAIDFYIGEVVNTDGTFVGDLFGGADEENDDSLRSRFFSALTSVDTEASIGRIKNVISAYSGISKFFVKNRVPGIIELWVRFSSENGTTTFLEEDINALKEYLLQYVPAGISISINEAKIKYFSLSISVVPYSSFYDSSSLNSDISAAINNVISELDLGETLSMSSITNAILPFVAKVVVTEPTADVVPKFDEVIMVSSVKLTLPTY